MREKMSEWVLHCAVDQRHVRRTQATRHPALEDACRQLAQGHAVNRIIRPNETINAHARNGAQASFVTRSHNPESRLVQPAFERPLDREKSAALGLRRSGAVLTFHKSLALHHARSGAALSRERASMRTWGRASVPPEHFKNIRAHGLAGFKTGADARPRPERLSKKCTLEMKACKSEASARDMRRPFIMSDRSRRSCVQAKLKDLIERAFSIADATLHRRRKPYPFGFAVRSNGSNFAFILDDTKDGSQAIAQVKTLFLQHDHRRRRIRPDGRPS